MRALNRAASAITVLAVVAVMSAIPALAVGTGGAWTNGEDVGAGAHEDGDTGGSSGGYGRSTCHYEALTPEEQDVAERMAEIGIGRAGEEPGDWWRRVCEFEDGTRTGNIVWLTDAVDAGALASGAWDVSRIPLPDINLNPSEERDQVVNVPTWLWVDGWARVSATASAGGVTVLVTASPSHVEWDMGDGTVVTCAGPGTPYDEDRPADEQSTDCSHTYTRSSASQADARYPIEATSYWHVTWSSSTGESGDLGVVGRTSSIRVRVAEIQAVNG